MTDEIALLIGAPTREIEAMAIREGMFTLGTTAYDSRSPASPRSPRCAASPATLSASNLRGTTSSGVAARRLARMAGSSSVTARYSPRSSAGGGSCMPTSSATSTTTSGPTRMARARRERACRAPVLRAAGSRAAPDRDDRLDASASSSRSCCRRCPRVSTPTSPPPSSNRPEPVSGCRPGSARQARAAAHGPARRAGARAPRPREPRRGRGVLSRGVSGHVVCAADARDGPYVGVRECGRLACIAGACLLTPLACGGIGTSPRCLSIVAGASLAKRAPRSAHTDRRGNRARSLATCAPTTRQQWPSYRSIGFGASRRATSRRRSKHDRVAAARWMDRVAGARAAHWFAPSAMAEVVGARERTDDVGVSPPPGGERREALERADEDVSVRPTRSYRPRASRSGSARTIARCRS